MAVTFVGAGTAVNGTTGGLAPPYPSGWAEGDLLIMVGFTRNNAREYTPTTGFSPVEYVTHASQEARLFWSWKIAAAGDDTTPNFAAAGSSVSGEVATAHVVAFRGTAVGAPVPGTGWTSSGTSQNVGPVPGVTVPADGAGLLVGGMMDDYSSTPATPSGWTQATTHETTLGSDASLASFYTLTAGATGTVTYDHNPSTNTHGAGLMFAITPPVLEGGGSDPYGDLISLAAPVAWWRGDGDVTDETGGSTGTAFGATYAASPMPSRPTAQAWSFDGTDDKVEIPDQAKLDPTGNFTLETWFVADSIGGSYRNVAGKEDWILEFDSSGLLRFIRTGANGARMSTTLSTGVLYHAVAVVDTSQMRLYVNGTEVGTASRPTFSDNSNPFRIGCWNGSSDWFDGIIGEVALYDRVLSDAEIAQHYTVGTTEPSVAEPAEGAATGSWSFAGTASGAATRSGAASGAWPFAGTATGEAPGPTGPYPADDLYPSDTVYPGVAIVAREGTAAGAWSFAGAATGERAPIGSASGSFAFTGTASGTTTRSGTASGAWTFTGSAAGSATRTGTATGTTTWSGAATGRSERSGAATGATTWVATATGLAPLGNTALGSWAFTGTAEGLTDRTGDATGATAWTGTAVGTSARTGTASGSVTWTGTAAGDAPRFAAATGSWAFVGSASGTTVRTGSATGAVAWTGLAFGATPVRDITLTAEITARALTGRLTPRALDVDLAPRGLTGTATPRRVTTALTPRRLAATVED